MMLIILGTQVILEAFRKSTNTGYMCKDASGPIEQVLFHFLNKSKGIITDPESKQKTPQRYIIDAQSVMETWAISHHKPIRACVDDGSLAELVNCQQNVSKCMYN